jgi:hypothetical protein
MVIEMKDEEINWIKERIKVEKLASNVDAKIGINVSYRKGYIHALQMILKEFEDD